MSNYEVEFKSSTVKELKNLPRQVSIGVLKAIDKLAINHRVGPVRPMLGSSSWRLRVGDYKVIYDINDKKLQILVIRVRHRKDFYKS